MNAPILSVVIPAFNRIGPLRHTLRSVASAAAQLPSGAVEILLVDDGSSPPLQIQLSDFDCGHPIRFLPQPNSGSIIARDHGLRISAGEFVQFVDSDDLVHPDKFSHQLQLLRTTGADVCYCDMADATLGPTGAVAEYRPTHVNAVETDPARFYLQVQPAPHSPLYRRAYLQAALATMIVPPHRRFDPAGDVWLYYNLAAHPARIVKLAEPLAIMVQHEDQRFSHHWEKLGLAALLLAEAFCANCPQNPSTHHVRAIVATTAFDSWRRLPYDFNRDFDARMLALWRQAPAGTVAPGGRGFQWLARILGAEAAGRVLRRCRGKPYSASRTLSDAAVAQLLSPPAP